jgi:hypothetical protein
MATGDYCTLAEIKSRLWPEGTAPDTISDTMLSGIISAVSRLVDLFCSRRFYTTVADETRYFTTEDNEYLFPDLDIISVTSIAVDYNGGRTYGAATTDYDLLPDNAARMASRTVISGSHNRRAANAPEGHQDRGKSAGRRPGGGRGLLIR